MKKMTWLIAFLGTMLLCSLLLVASILVPQSQITQNLEKSLDQLNLEGCYPLVFDHSADANILDNTTDSLMLMQTYYSSDWDALWSNSWNRSEGGLVVGLTETVRNNAPANYTYSRYWGSFRVTLRVLLMFFSFPEIRHITATCFFLLFVLSFLAIYKQSDGLSATAFALSIILVRPEIVSNSPHYSCCFLIAFLAVIWMPTLIRKNISLTTVFVVIGCLTQFFDYYTVPIITFAFPFVMALLTMRQISGKHQMILLLKSFAAWFASWIAMWFFKLVFTTLFTNENAFAVAFSSVSKRLGVVQIEGVEDSYNPIATISAVMRTLFQSPSFMLFVLAVLSVFILVCIAVLKPTLPKAIRIGLTRGYVFAFLSMLPLAWYIITCSPTVLHAFFQYRGISVSIFSSLLLIIQLFKNEDIHCSKIQ